MVDDSIASLMAIGFTALLLSALTSLGWLNAPIDLRGQAAAITSDLNTRIEESQFGKTVLAQRPSKAADGTQTGTVVNGQTASIVNASQAPLSNWSAKLGLDHPLLGTIWSPDRQEAITPAVLAREAARADIVLVGETHDNPDHHNLQAWVIRELVRKGRRPAVAMEMIGADQAPVLSNYLSRLGATPEELGPILGWNTHWPDWSMYQPIAKAAMDSALPIIPADAEADRVDQVSRGGLRLLAETERTRLGLATPLPSVETAALLAEIKAAHCGLLPADSIEPMSQVQRFRDATMADNLINAAAKSNGGAVLIAGGGHVRADRAVPYYVRLRAPQYRTVSILLMEVDDAIRDANAMVPKDANGQPVADYVWFTARAQRGDQCEDMRNAMNKKSSG
jgi:uncharacterized iron-regulated protein